MNDGRLVEVAALLAGVLLAVVTWLSVLRTVFVPGRCSSRTMRVAVRCMRTLGSAVGCRLPHALGERWMELCAPLALCLAGTSWLVATLAGFALSAPALAGVPFTPDGLARFLLLRTGSTTGDLLGVAAWGAVLLELSAFFSHVFRVVSAYGRRELVVARMSPRAVRPTDAERLLAELGPSRDQLDRFFTRWAEWLADLRTTHTGCPVLTIYRPATEACWLDAAVLVLDAAALTEAVTADWAPPSTRAVLEAGSACLPTLAEQVGVSMSRPTVSLEGREECCFEHTVSFVTDAGLPPGRDHHAAWPVFQNWRTRYAPYAMAMRVRLCYRLPNQSE